MRTKPARLHLWQPAIPILILASLLSETEICRAKPDVTSLKLVRERYLVWILLGESIDFPLQNAGWALAAPLLSDELTAEERMERDRCASCATTSIQEQANQRPVSGLSQNRGFINTAVPDILIPPAT